MKTKEILGVEVTIKFFVAMQDVTRIASRPEETPSARLARVVDTAFNDLAERLVVHPIDVQVTVE